MSDEVVKAELDELERLLDLALALPAGERAAYVAQLPGLTPALRERLETTLKQCEKIDAIAALFSRKSARRADADDRLGARIGPYRLERLLGEGGMGAVYLAVRDVGTVRQEVALKLLHDKQGVRRARERFERERKILASISHPGIASMFDLGEADDGTPYYTMEYVDGLPIVQWCREHAPTVEARVRVLLRVATALAHAHRALVVHRDIKPSNIFVRGADDVKVLDFGIAKILESTNEPAVTATAIAPMTLEYAAPEQLRGGAITVATDIYQFGALVYRVLTGALPYDASPGDTYEWLRIVVEDEPRTLSRAMLEESGGLAWHEGAPIARLARRLAGDLDAIARKALAKQPDQRYRTMDAMVDDLEHFLAGLPVRARRASPLYRMRRFVGRHLPESVLIVVAIAGFGLAVNELRLERDRALMAEARQASLAEAGADLASLLAQVLGPMRADGARDAALVDEFLSRLAQQSRELAAESPDERAALTLLVANLYEGLGLWSKAQPFLVEAATLHEQSIHTPRAVVVQTLARLANNEAITGTGDVASVVARAQATLARAGDDAPIERFHAERMLGFALMTLGRYRDALAHVQAARARSDELFAIGSREHIWAVWDEARALARIKRYVEAEPRYDEALASAVKLFGPLHVYTGRIRVERAVTLSEVGRIDEADAECRLMIEGDAGDTAMAEGYECLATVETARSRFGQAADLQRRVTELFGRLEGLESPRYSMSLRELAQLELKLGRHDDAARDFATAIALQERLVPARHARLAQSYVLRAPLEIRAGRLDQAERELTAAQSMFDEAYGPGSGAAGHAALGLAEVARARGRTAEAVEHRDRALRSFRALTPSRYRDESLAAVAAYDRASR